MVQIDKANIRRRKARLEACAAYLKAEFIGIDAIIDSLLDYIQVWYLLPELLTRPVIVNLWGMTGVGKTDLVRKTVRFLDLQERFAEIELSNSDQSSWVATVAKKLNDHALQDEKPAIILFDEIQRFNTLDREGKPVPQTKFTDFWELLSDGRLSKKSKDDLDSFLFNYLSNKRKNEAARARGEEVTTPDGLSSWDAMLLKKSLGLDISLEDMVALTEDQMIELIMQAKQQKKIYEPVNHAKTLIIISGNLDEAFAMAHETSEADVDADIYHAFTEKITAVDIKNALTRKFRPEQVARFGNIHLIYRSLRRRDFEALIQKEIDRVGRQMREKAGIELTVGPAVNRLIYRNGVFPVQGVRPVFSSVVDILEANVSKFMFAALMDGADRLHIDYDTAGERVVATYGGRTLHVPYVGRMDAIRRDNEADAVANISVHEAGHAVLYMLVMGMAPLQLKSKLANSYAGGFAFPHHVYATKQGILDKIKVYLAGGIAEDVVFGEGRASVGRRHDRDQATRLAVDFVRKYGFDETFQAVYNIDEKPYEMDSSVTDQPVERLISGLVAVVRATLEEHRPLLLDLSRELNERGTLEPAQMKATAGRHGVEVSLRKEGYMAIAGYAKLLADA